MIDSEESFFLIDTAGHRRVPVVMKARDGREGFAVHPVGKGNDASAAEYTPDLKTVVQSVVLHGKLVRARAVGGPQDGQRNSVGLSGSSIRGYWLVPALRHWVAGATRASEELP